MALHMQFRLVCGGATEPMAGRREKLRTSALCLTTWPVWWWDATAVWHPDKRPIRRLAPPLSPCTSSSSAGWILLVLKVHKQQQNPTESQIFKVWQEGRSGWAGKFGPVKHCWSTFNFLCFFSCKLEADVQTFVLPTKNVCFEVSLQLRQVTHVVNLSSVVVETDSTVQKQDHDIKSQVWIRRPDCPRTLLVHMCTNPTEELKRHSFRATTH